MTRILHLEAPRDLVRRPVVARLLSLLSEGGEEARVVGGAVRNALLGREVTEIDLATTALPAETMSRAAEAGLKAVPTGIDHGTVTVILDGVPYEVTTLREDVETDGRHARVRFGRSFAADAMRRDFTVNGLSVGADGDVHDVTGGVQDLEVGRVRFIGEPRQRIREDFLRILRFFRFSAEYAEGALDPEGLDAAIRERDGLDLLSRERVRAELLKLLAAAQAPEIVSVLGEAGLLARLTGSVAELGRLERAPLDPILRLAALLVRTSEDAERLRERLRLSNAEHERLSTYGQLLARVRSVSAFDRPEARRLAATFGTVPLLQTLRIVAGEPRPQVTEDGRVQVDAFAAGDLAPVFRLSGADLIRQGIPAGPDLGRRLAEARAAWLAAGCPDG